MNTKLNTIRIRCEDELKQALEQAARESGHEDMSKLARHILTQWLLDQELKKLHVSKIKP